VLQAPHPPAGARERGGAAFRPPQARGGDAPEVAASVAGRERIASVRALPHPPPVAEDRLLAAARVHRDGLYCGWGTHGPVFAAPEQCALVLGPPRSGKTTAVVVPNVLAARGSVVCISTKGDVLEATAGARARRGPVFVFDPSGERADRSGALAVSWSPLDRAAGWDRAVLAAEAMVGASGTARVGEHSHWGERAGALLSSLFHGGALARMTMAEVCSAVDRRSPERLLAALSDGEATVARDVLNGILYTDAREQSGIWSTASGVLRAYRTGAARASSEGRPLPMEELVRGPATLYIVAGSEQQEHLAPIVAGLVRDLRSVTYERHWALAGTKAPPLLLVLDELANIAPLHDLPVLVAEGASQGLLTLACLQDLSQARARWGVAAEGFFSLFGTKLVLGGVGDRGTLETLSLLAGEHDVAHRSVSRGRPRLRGGGGVQRTLTTRRERRLAPDAASTPGPGVAYCVFGTTIGRVALPPWFGPPPPQLASRAR